MLRKTKVLLNLEAAASRFCKPVWAKSLNAFAFSSEKEEKEQKKHAEYFDPKKKISANDFLKMELSQNPEFDKAFPFLRSHKKASTLFPKNEEHDFIESLRFVLLFLRNETDSR